MTLSRPSRAALLGLLIAGAPGCSSGSETDDTPEKGSPNGPIWTSESDSIEIEWFSFWQGGVRFGKAQEELTTDELAIVESMATVADNGNCFTDSAVATITVDSDGVLNEYSTSEYGGDCYHDKPLIAYEPVQALLDLADCNSAKAYDGSTLETAPPITANDGCYHGLFNATTTTPKWWFALEVPTAGTLRVTLAECGDRDLELSLLDVTGMTTIASATSASGASGSCPELVLDREAGSYVVHVDMRAGTYAGDFFLRVESGA
jgi:hypothetical protein